jgi:hypothetical protein
MKVTDWRRWQMTKLTVVFILLIIGIACAGGLEDADGTQPIPSVWGFVAAMSFAAMLLWNIIQNDRQGRK